MSLKKKERKSHHIWDKIQISPYQVGFLTTQSLVDRSGSGSYFFLVSGIGQDTDVCGMCSKWQPLNPPTTRWCWYYCHHPYRQGICMTLSHESGLQLKTLFLKTLLSWIKGANSPSWGWSKAFGEGSLTLICELSTNKHSKRFYWGAVRHQILV